MNKQMYLTPYIDVSSEYGYPIFQRHFAGIDYALSVWYSNGKWITHHSYDDYSSKEEAMDDLDKHCIAMGYVLLTEKQVLLI